ncbi:benzoate/H(+) symporter BenE family transporter [Microvirga arsenatis]|uniref:Benzoate/H(+) symporter BenE family transporter n=1 Tax=Microvirga arsenatis TaxID=2692265 RepID=A0ABW9Z2K5_9HYPH|nr:benzoate/H(+) symporter BenE family transporter [Microvirga arsenatis]NBJ13283.1 benzoate/H(+) symporter BenE family transporter [Microvirga arsenatis]NBJ26922.1 benzoate/H(+) symporter BenE family transporter [Microvirga arsenatis]
MRLSIVTSAVVAALVGFGSTIAIIIAAAQAVGADPAQTSSWVAALCLAMAATSGPLSVRYRMPVITAWSTPGAALVAASTDLSIHAAVGAFLLAGALIVLAAFIKPFGRLIERIPTAIAAAMLAGVLLQFVVGVFQSAQGAPGLVLPLVALFLVVRLFNPALAVLAVLFVGLGLAFGSGMARPLTSGLTLSSLTFIAPSFEPAALIGLGLPLFLVTMASQNLPGFAVLKASGYQPPSRPILAGTGLASIVTAFFGAHTSNLAAISAAICTGPDTHPDPSKRWMVGPFYSLSYLAFAAFSAALIGLIAALPPELIKTVAGLALIGSFAGALGSSLSEDAKRFPAVVTFAVTASGLTLFGIGSAFWGLVAGLTALGLDEAAHRLRRRA